MILMNSTLTARPGQEFWHLEALQVQEHSMNQ